MGRRFWLVQGLVAAPLTIYTVITAWQQATEAGGTARPGLFHKLGGVITHSDPTVWKLFGVGLVVSVFYGVFFDGWDHGPPDWARALTAFAFGVLGFLAAGALWLYVFVYLALDPLFGPGTLDRGPGHSGGASAYVFFWGLCVGTVFAGFVASFIGSLARSWLMSAGSGSGSIVAAGSAIGAAAGTTIAVSVIAFIIAIVLFVVVFYVMLVVAFGLVLACFVGAASD